MIAMLQRQDCDASRTAKMSCAVVSPHFAYATQESIELKKPSLNILLEEYETSYHT